MYIVLYSDFIINIFVLLQVILILLLFHFLKLNIFAFYIIREHVFRS
jgi:hypothetical protein